MNCISLQSFEETLKRLIQKKKQKGELVEVKIGTLKPGTVFTWEKDLGFGGHVLKQENNITLVLDDGCDGKTFMHRYLPSDMKVWTNYDVLPESVWNWLGEY